MQGIYDLWLVACSFLVAVVASYAALEIAGRVVVSQGRATWAWVTGGAIAMGLGIWSMHFIGMLAFSLPVPLAYDVSITLWSVVPAVLSAALVLAMVRGGSLSGVRLTASSILLGCGIATMHYTGMAAIPILPPIRYDPVMFTVSVVVAVVVAYVALRLAFSLSGPTSRRKKLGAALIMAGGICAMHYTGMAAAIFAPDSICTVTPDAINNKWLAAVIAFNTLLVLLATVAIAFFDARLADQNARAAQALKLINEALLERTHSAEQSEAALRDTESRFRSLLELAPDAIVIADDKGRIVLVNSQTERLFGYTREKLLASSSELLIPERYREKHIAQRSRFLANPGLQPTGASQELRGLRRDGSEFPMEMSMSPLETEQGILAMGSIRDITERKKSEQNLKEAYSELAAGHKALELRNREILLLAELGNFLIACVTVEEACDAIPKYCELLFPGERGVLYLFRSSRDHLNQYASWGGAGNAVPAFKPEDCWALRRGRPYTMFDPQKDAICGHVAGHNRESAYMCVPLVVQSDLLGLMWITIARCENTESVLDAPMSIEQQLAVALSERIALALSNIRLRENLRQQTIRDPLTGLYNRRFLEESVNREIARCKRKETGFGMLMIDIDHFKRFNDSFGHEAGDSVLREVAHALQKNTREGDIVCRFGGEEFTIVLPDADRNGAVIRAERLLAIVRDLQVKHNDKKLGSITVSIGLAVYPQNGETVNAIIESADKLLYQAKRAGRDRLVTESK